MTKATARTTNTNIKMALAAKIRSGTTGSLA